MLKQTAPTLQCVSGGSTVDAVADAAWAEDVGHDDAAADSPERCRVVPRSHFSWPLTRPGSRPLTGRLAAVPAEVGPALGAVIPPGRSPMGTVDPMAGALPVAPSACDAGDGGLARDLDQRPAAEHSAVAEPWEALRAATPLPLGLHRSTAAFSSAASYSAGHESPAFYSAASSSRIPQSLLLDRRQFSLGCQVPPAIAWNPVIQQPAPPPNSPVAWRTAPRTTDCLSGFATHQAGSLPRVKLDVSEVPVTTASSASTPAATATTTATAVMPGRPAKRSPGGDEGDVPSESIPSKMKLPRLDRGPGDFSSVVKSRLQSYTRTGQACDRCKVRKIRCDTSADGCSHCSSQGIDCVVTDRVSGRTERRGYTQELERKENDMMSHIRAMEQLLDDKGIHVHPYQWSPFGHYPPGHGVDSRGHAVQDPSVKEHWEKVGPLWIRDWHLASTSLERSFPRALLKSRPADSHLGVGSDSAPMSSINGTQLSILGTTIDVTSFDAPDIDEPGPEAGATQPLYNKSLQAFLQSTMNINPRLENVTLPQREEGFTYSEWYFLMVFPFVPMLHKPSYLKLLTRIYDEPGFEPSIPELVIVHMVFAMIYYQYGVRNWEQPEQRAKLNDLSNKHYHFALSKFYDLASSQSLTAVQAMTMLAAHSRSFPKPSCGSLLTNFALTRAIELNLHRSVQKPGDRTNLEIEMRKRVWWAILCISVTLNGRLGKPMPISVEEFDVDFPEAIPDECLTEDGVDESRPGQVTYHVGLVGFKIVPLFMEMYANIYSVRRDPKTYAAVVVALEGQLQLWKDHLPDTLKMGQNGQAEHEGRMYALYAQLYAVEFRLCLRHPSVALTNDKKLLSENTRICEETAKEMLAVVHTLLKLKSLDTTWYQISVYVAAIFSTLVAQWERRYQATSGDVAALRDDMSKWLVILNETASFVGSGPGISNQIRAIIERTITWIEKDRGNNISRPDSDSTTPQRPKQELQPTSYDSRAAMLQAAPIGGPSVQYHDSNGHNGQTPYPSLAYADQAGAATPYVASAGALFYAPASGQQPAGQTDEQDDQSNPLIAFASQATQHVAHQQPTDLIWPAAAEEQTTWTQWRAAIADSEDRYSASALLTLGGAQRDPSSAMAATAAAAVGDPDETSQTGQWPLLLFNGTVHTT